MNELRSRPNRKNVPPILALMLKSARTYYSKLERSIRLKEN
jgi:hypothetical protein